MKKNTAEIPDQKTDAPKSPVTKKSKPAESPPSPLELAHLAALLKTGCQLDPASATQAAREALMLWDACRSELKRPVEEPQQTAIPLLPTVSAATPTVPLKRFLIDVVRGRDPEREENFLEFLHSHVWENDWRAWGGEAICAYEEYPAYVLEHIASSGTGASIPERAQAICKRLQTEGVSNAEYMSMQSSYEVWKKKKRSKGSQNGAIAMLANKKAQAAAGAPNPTDAQPAEITKPVKTKN